jgi:hypothetical protein
MYRSLEKQSEDFHLYIFAFDDEAFRILNALELKYATVITLKDFESPELLNVKSDRSQAEYCWTSTPSTIEYCLKTYQLDHCIYVDADLYFYRDPMEIIKMAKDNSVIITPHNYSKRYDQASSSGIYCVQFMYFKNDEKGLIVLNWWKEACIDWCFARHEDGKFGDQKYLDDWTSRFEGVFSSTEIGIGLAPWNVQQISLTDKNLDLKFKKDHSIHALYFYHYHGVKFLDNGYVDLNVYLLSKDVIDRLYKPYVAEVLEQLELLKDLSDDPKLSSIVRPAKDFKYYKHVLARKVKGVWNMIKLP